MKKGNKYLELLAAFFNIGLFTFGGGYAMISVIMNELVEKKKWITSDELMDVVAIAESTPGPIAINSATYIGYRRAGFWGSLGASVGVVMPSFIIIYLISLCVDWFMGFKAVQSAFAGIQVAVAILILRAGIKMVVKVKKQIVPMICMLVSIVVVILVNFGIMDLSTIWLIFAGAVVGLVSLPLQGKGDKKNV